MFLAETLLRILLRYLIRADGCPEEVLVATSIEKV